MTYRLGLLGENISYTLSPLIHGEIFSYLSLDAKFEVYDTPMEKFAQTVREMLQTLNGFNVTKPYKTDIIDFLDGEYSGCGAVNTVRVSGGNALGFNTDGFGFMKSFQERYSFKRGEKAVILGAGGAARIVAKQLKESGLDVYVKNRSEDRQRAFCLELGVKEYGAECADIMVNCTSSGFRRGENPAAGLNTDNLKFAYDLIYAPAETDFLAAARKQGAATVNGLDMLIYQAVKADEIILSLPAFSDDDYSRIKKAAYTSLKKHGIEV